jgi:hypothetical protein
MLDVHRHDSASMTVIRRSGWGGKPYRLGLHRGSTAFNIEAAEDYRRSAAQDHGAEQNNSRFSLGHGRGVEKKIELTAELKYPDIAFQEILTRPSQFVALPGEDGESFEPYFGLSWGNETCNEGHSCGTRG